MSSDNEHHKFLLMEQTFSNFKYITQNIKRRTASWVITVVLIIFYFVFLYFYVFISISLIKKKTIPLFCYITSHQSHHHQSGATPKKKIVPKRRNLPHLKPQAPMKKLPLSPRQIHNIYSRNQNNSGRREEGTEEEAKAPKATDSGLSYWPLGHFWHLHVCW